MGILARDVMVSPLLTLPPSASVADAARAMVDHQVGSVLVTDLQGRLIGILTESDFAGQGFGLPFSDLPLARVFGRFVSLDGLDTVYRESVHYPVSRFMSKDPVTVAPEHSIEAAVEHMIARNIKHVPVVVDGKPVGMIARHDLMRVLLDLVARPKGPARSG